MTTGLCINPSKSKCLLLSRSKRAFDVSNIAIRRNFVESVSNLGIIFNGRQKFTVCLEIYGLLYIDSTPFAIRMQLPERFLISVLLHRKFSQAVIPMIYGIHIYNNITRYVFIKRRRDHTSTFSYRILELILIIY